MLNDKGCERAVLAGICQYGSDGFFEVNDILESSVFTDISNQLIFIFKTLLITTSKFL